jgi:hypothetical protein
MKIGKKILLFAIMAIFMNCESLDSFLGTEDTKDDESEYVEPKCQDYVVNVNVFVDDIYGNGLSNAKVIMNFEGTNAGNNRTAYTDSEGKTNGFKMTDGVCNDEGVSPSHRIKTLVVTASKNGYKSYTRSKSVDMVTDYSINFNFNLSQQ